jgi:quercetin dioxygenase-like cupin family protein
MTSPYIAQADDHQRLAWLGTSTLEVLLDGAATGGQLALIRTELQRGDAAPLHVHSVEDEIMVIVSGDVTFWVGEQRQEVTAGGLAWMPRGLAHTYRVDSEQASVLTICTPGGLEGFFRQAGHDLATPRPAGWAVTPQSLGAALVAHGGSVLGPPKGLDD